MTRACIRVGTSSIFRMRTTILQVGRTKRKRARRPSLRIIYVTQRNRLGVTFQRCFSTPIYQVIARRSLRRSFDSLGYLDRINMIKRKEDSTIFRTNRYGKIISPIRGTITIRRRLPSRTIFPSSRTIRVNGPIGFKFPSYMDTVIIISRSKRRSIFYTRL